MYTVRIIKRYFAPSEYTLALVSLRLGHAQGKTILNCFLTLSRRSAT